MLVLAGCGGSAPDSAKSSAARTLPAVEVTPAGALERLADSPGQVPAPAPAGLVTLTSPLSVADTVENLIAALAANDNISIVAQIEHGVNADRVGLVLPLTVEVLFGNPNLGTPLMNATRSVGIDLPQKILVYESADSSTVIAWNAASYLASRHSLSGVDEQLTMIDGALVTLAAAAAGDPTLTPNQPAASTVGERAGLITKTTTGTVDEAVARLVAAIDGNDQLVLVTQLDHAANAAGVGLQLPPTVEVIFGNPNLGTPLMQAQRTVAIDLPQKILIAEEDGQITVTYNDPAYLAERHGIDAQTPELAAIAGALDNLSDAALAPATATTTTTTTIVPDPGGVLPRTQ